MAHHCRWNQYARCNQTTEVAFMLAVAIRSQSDAPLRHTELKAPPQWLSCFVLRSAAAALRLPPICCFDPAACDVLAPKGPPANNYYFYKPAESTLAAARQLARYGEASAGQSLPSGPVPTGSMRPSYMFTQDSGLMGI